MLNRKERRYSKKYWKKEIKKSNFDEFLNLTCEMKTKRIIAGKNNKDFIGFYKNSIYSVTIFSKDKFDLLGIRRHDEKPIRNWESLLKIKNCLGYCNDWAIECYPPKGKEINVANMYWLWVYLDGEKPPVDLSKTNL